MRFLVTGLFLVGMPLIAAADDKTSGKWATVKGRVMIDGDAPARLPANIPANHPDAAFCQKDGPVLSETWVVNPKNKGLKDVVLWIEPAGHKFGNPLPANFIHPTLAKPDPKPVEIDQPCCQFIPHVVAARVGQTLLVKNSAPKAHNANWAPFANDPFNFALAAGQSQKVELKKAEQRPRPLECNIHGWMKAHIGVFDHPYFAVTDADGRFEIKLVPQGDLRLMVWNETGYNRGKEGASGVPLKAEGGVVDLKEIKFVVPLPPKKQTGPGGAKR